MRRLSRGSVVEIYPISLRISRVKGVGGRTIRAMTTCISIAVVTRCSGRV